MLYAASFVLLATTHAAAAEDSHWTRNTIDASSRGADGVRLADINGDGLVDIATAWEEGGVVRVAIHPGNEHVTQPWPAVTVGRVNSGEDAVFADVDGDGRLDVVSACEGETRSLFVHWSPPNQTDLLNPDAWSTELLQASEKRMQFMFVLPMDVNGDGRIDLVTGGKNDDAALGWFEAPEHPRDLGGWSWHELGPMGWVMSIRARDVNADGRDDLLVSDRRGANRGVYGLVRPADPLAHWSRIDYGGHDAEVMFLDTAQAGFGLFDIAWAERRGPARMLRVNPHAPERRRNREQSIPLPANAGSGKAVAMGDMNEDGYADLVVSCESAEDVHGVFALIRPSAMTSRVPDWSFMDISGTEGTKFDRIELIDLDGDGDLDVLTCEERENLGVIWYENPHAPKEAVE